MRIKRILGVVLILLGILLAAVVCMVLFWLGPTVKLAAEKIGSRALGTSVSIDRLAINPRKGTFRLSGFAIANPTNFARSKAFSLADVDIAMDMGSIFSPTIMVNHIWIESPHFTYEQNMNTDNISEFIRNIETFARIDPDTPGKEIEPEPLDDDSESRKFVIVESLEINDAQFHLASTTTPEIDAQLGIKQAEASMTNGTARIDTIEMKLLDTTQTNAPAVARILASIETIRTQFEDGELKIENIAIPNPEGFDATNLFHLPGITVMFDPRSLVSDQVVINEVFIDSPELNLEQTETTGNAVELQKTLATFMPTTTKAAFTSETNTSSNEAVPLADQPVVLHTLLTTNLSINFIPSPTVNWALFGQQGKVPLKKLNPLSGMGRRSTTHPPSKNGTIVLAAFDLLRVEPLNGLVKLDNLRVGNPPGFANRNLTSISRFRLDFDPDSLSTDTLLIKEILIDRPRVAYERQVMTDNIKAMQALVEEALAVREESLRQTEVVEQQPADPVAEEEQKVIIEHLLVQNGLVRAKVSTLPSAPIPLPKIELSDIGKKEGGTSYANAFSTLGGIFYNSIVGSVSGATGFAGDALKGAGAFTLGTIGNITDTIKAPLKIIRPAVDSEQEEPKEPEQSEEPSKPRKRRLFRKTPGRTF